MAQPLNGYSGSSHVTPGERTPGRRPSRDLRSGNSSRQNLRPGVASPDVIQMSRLRSGASSRQDLRSATASPNPQPITRSTTKRSAKAKRVRIHGDDEQEQTSSDSISPGTTPPIPPSTISQAPGEDEKIYVETSIVPSHFPTHPLSQMQGAFVESMLDAGKDEDSSNYRETDPEKFKGASRRSLILKQTGGAGNISYSAKWREDPASQHHPIIKIMSQVVFGVHLLCQAMAQSVPEVSTILRGFVQELDSFLGRVNGDLDMALKDTSELYRNLSLPLQHVNVFDNLLSDRKYRTQTLQGNIRIDALIKAYSQMRDDYIIDLTRLGESNEEFSRYLARIGEDWTRESIEQWNIYDAMRKNIEIWNMNARVLLDKAAKLGKSLQKCSLCVNEFEKRCAAAARRQMSSRTSSRSSLSRSVSATSPVDAKKSEKPLPAIPAKPEFASSNPSTPLRQVMNADSTPSRSVSKVRLRPKPYANVAGGRMLPREPQPSESTAELAAFLRNVPPPNDSLDAPSPFEPTTSMHIQPPTAGRKNSEPTLFLAKQRSRQGSATSANNPYPIPGSTASSRPVTANSVSAKHIPLWTLMEHHQSPNTTSSEESGMTAATPMRRDSAVASGRGSRASNSGKSHARKPSSPSRIRFMFRNPFKR